MEEHESVKTQRQEWDELFTKTQSEVNEQLDSLRFEVERANHVLANDFSGDRAGMLGYARDVIVYLDEKWEYHNVEFMVTGRWLAPKVESAGDAVYIRNVEEEVFKVAHSDGFNLSLGNGSTAPRIGMSFVVGNHKIATAAARGPIKLMAFANLNDISLHCMQPKSADVSTDVGEAIASMRQADSILDLYVSHRDSSFYKQPAKKQEEFFRSIIDLGSSGMPAPSSGDRLIVSRAKMSTLILGTAGSELSMLEAEDEPFVISGQVMGVAIADMVQDGFGKKYSSPSQLAHAKYGVCLVVNPSKTGSDEKASRDSYLLLPVRMTKDDSYDLL